MTDLSSQFGGTYYDGGVDPRGVSLEHLHAAVSGWFDDTAAEHAAATKPYALSPMSRSSTDRPAEVGFELGVLTDEAFARLRSAGRPGRSIRFGGQHGRLGSAVGLARESWDALAKPSGACAWELEFVTPATFRSRNRSSPWSAPPAVVRGLGESWKQHSGLPPRERSHLQLDSIWVSDVDGRSEPMTLSNLRVSGFVGRIRYQCDDKAVADLVDPLFRLAVYSGVGSAKAKGLGVTRLPGTWQPSVRTSRAS